MKKRRIIIIVIIVDMTEIFTHSRRGIVVKNVSKKTVVRNIGKIDNQKIHLAKKRK